MRPELENLTCPHCDGPMSPRTNSKTKQKFWGCNNYPECKGTRNVDGMSKEDRDRYREDEDDTWHPGHPNNYGDN